VSTTRQQVEQIKQTTAPLRIGQIESSRVEMPIGADTSPKQQKPVEIVKAYQKYPETRTSEVEMQESTMKGQPIKPIVLQPLRNVNLVEGGQAVFECKIQGNPLDIKWYKGDKELKNQYRHKISYDDRTHTAKLLISTVFEDDADQYTCRASNQLGEVSTSARLTPQAGWKNKQINLSLNI
jgi:hypothetical protein